MTVTLLVAGAETVPLAGDTLAQESVPVCTAGPTTRSSRYQPASTVLPFEIIRNRMVTTFPT